MYYQHPLKPLNTYNCKTAQWVKTFYGFPYNAEAVSITVITMHIRIKFTNF